MQECVREARKGQGEHLAPETAPTGKIPLSETEQEKGMCSEEEKRVSGLKAHLFCQLLQPFPGPAGGEKKKKKKARSCLTFQPPKVD